MNLKRKLELAKQNVLSISRHDDESEDNVLGTLNALAKHIGDEASAFVARKKEAATAAEQE